MLLSMGLLVKLQNQYKILSDFKIWNQNHTQKIGLSLPENLANVYRLTKQLFQWRTLYYFDQQSSKGKKGTIVAMIAGTKAQAVIAIIEKYRLNYEIQF
jgi:hypothetical protein